MIYRFCGKAYATTEEEANKWSFGYTVAKAATPAFHTPPYRQELYRLTLMQERRAGKPYDMACRIAQKFAKSVTLYIRKSR